MLGKGRWVWATAVISALLVLMLCVLSGCGSTQSTGPTGTQPPAQGEPAQTGPTVTQPPAQEQPAQTSPAQQQTLPGAAQNAEPEKEKSETASPILQNADFEMGHYAWSPQEGTIVKEENGNKCMRASYTWGLYQFMQVEPGKTYQIYCKARQGTEPASPARMSIIFYDSNHKIMKESLDIICSPGTQWDYFPKKSFTVPQNAVFTKLFLLSNGNGSVCFDNISVSLLIRESTTPGAK